MLEAMGSGRVEGRGGGVPAVGINLTSLLVGDRGGDDHVVALVPLCRVARRWAAVNCRESITRSQADNAALRNLFVIGPDKKIKLVLVYLMTTWSQLR